MPLPIKFKKIHFLALFFVIVGVLYVVRIVRPDVCTLSGTVDSSLMASAEGYFPSSVDSLMIDGSAGFDEMDEEDAVKNESTDTATLSLPVDDPMMANRILKHSKKVDELYQQPRADVKLVDYRGRPVKNKVRGVSSYVRVFNDLNDVQIATASRVGIDRIADRKAAAATKDSLVFVGDNPYYTVKKLTHSIPYLVPRAAVCLEEISRAFMDSCVTKGIPMHKLVLTSVLRTENDVKKLRRVNVNASQNSCHQHGTTFDISYNHFVMVQNPNSSPKRPVPMSTLKQILAEVLEDQRDLGTCYVKYEYRRSACFHITAR